MLAFHDKLASLTFLDPACGCGNFLVVAYRELRRLEHDVIATLFPDHALIDVNSFVKLNVDAMHGIEVEEWPARIAEVAMWLIDHQMNLEASQRFGKPLVRLPLRKTAKIAHANALRLDWNSVLPAGECAYVMGNPPFVGAKFMSDGQRADFEHVAGDIDNFGLLDFVTAWHLKASAYIAASGDRATEVAFVSTNSICQGEQVGVLWGELLKRGVHIRFAYRTFSWQSEARGAAHVHVIIVGFRKSDAGPKTIIEVDDNGTLNRADAKNINPYLIDAPDVVMSNRSTPLCDVPAATTGNKPIDDGNYLFTPAERKEFLLKEPSAERLFKRWLGGEEFLNGIERWCLHLESIDPSTLRRMPEVLKRVAAVKKFREESKSGPTQRLALTPTRFHTTFAATAPYIALAQVSSERRPYIPMAFLSDDVLCGDKLRLIPNATLYHFGVLHSAMHMAWVRVVTGRLKSDFQWSVKLVYNNFPWPDSPADKPRAAVEAAAQAVLDARLAFPDQTLADLYDPLAMPKPLRDAHRALDAAVDRCYRSAPFVSERARVEFLFDRHQCLVTPLAVPATPSRRRRARGGTPPPDSTKG